MGALGAGTAKSYRRGIEGLGKAGRARSAFRCWPAGSQPRAWANSPLLSPPEPTADVGIDDMPRILEVEAPCGHCPSAHLEMKSTCLLQNEPTCLTKGPGRPRGAETILRPPDLLVAEPRAQVTRIPIQGFPAPHLGCLPCPEA